MGDDVPLLERVGRVVTERATHDDATHILANLQEGAQCRVLQRLQIVIQIGLAVVTTIGDVRQEEVDLFVGDDVADALRTVQAAEGQADHFVVCHCGAAAVASIDGGINLDAQA